MSSTHIVTDLGFGDAGKGTIVDALARRCSAPPLVVRHNGGAQAGHNVHTADGRHHTFSQFGSATFVPGSRTLLSQHMVLHLGGLLAERKHLLEIGVHDPFRVMVDERALLITPYQQAVNRLRETARGASRHGSCGIGVGETVSDSLSHDADVLRARDLRDPALLRRKLSRIRDLNRAKIEPFLSTIDRTSDDLRKLEEPDTLGNVAANFEYVAMMKLSVIDPANVDFQIREAEHVIFEGAQGVLLDEWHGFHPHTTWSTTTTANADELIRRSERTGEVTRIGVLRAYATRHGQGPFPSESAWLTERLRDSHNVDTGWQGRFRAGWFDVPLVRYALSVCPGISQLAVTCLDRLAESPEWSFCQEYDPAVHFQTTRDLSYQETLTHALTHCSPVFRKVSGAVDNYVKEIEAATKLPVAIMSLGRTAEDKRWGGES